ncbi:hypothetical protein [Geotalea toluenoxydans]|uniref:hypothetical protein n=1 Tax=Geotalea toluenoxydans TaxID=421624 RepID=UPI000B0B8C4B|nr:hypothetical protein [Geotalea toluenoxydans]
MRGIGNAYADEILWEARISPLSLMGKLPPRTIEVLAEKIPAVLQWAIVSIKERNPASLPVRSGISCRCITLPAKHHPRADRSSRRRLPRRRPIIPMSRNYMYRIVRRKFLTYLCGFR